MSDDDNDVPPLEDIPVAPTKSKPVSTPVVKYVQAAPEPKGEKSEPGASFAGMKKGFLGGDSTSKPKSQELIEVKRQTTGTAKDFRVLDEVQQVISDEQKAKNPWMTDDLLQQIEDDDSLSQYFSNPYFMEAITLFQHKPQEALAKYGHNAEVMRFFDRMAKILGTHFTAIAGQNEQQAKKTAVDPEVNKLLQDESVRTLLVDPLVIELMKALREQPEKAQWMMRTADASMRAKIQRACPTRPPQCGVKYRIPILSVIRVANVSPRC